MTLCSIVGLGERSQLGELREAIKKKKSESWDIVPTGGGSHRRGGMSQPTYLVTFFGEPKLCFGAEIIVFFKKIQIFFN